MSNNSKITSSSLRLHNQLDFNRHAKHKSPIQSPETARVQETKTLSNKKINKQKQAQATAYHSEIGENRATHLRIHPKLEKYQSISA